MKRQVMNAPSPAVFLLQTTHVPNWLHVLWFPAHFPPPRVILELTELKWFRKRTRSADSMS